MRCDVCHLDPCETPGFCDACRKDNDRRGQPPHWREYHEGGTAEYVAASNVTPLKRRPAESPLPLGYTAAELRNQVFAPLNWIVPCYIPEGVTLLAGKPKVGKSWLMLAIALAVTRANVVLNQTCQRRIVLYYALEDTKRRMQDRIAKIMVDDPDWPINLIFKHELPALENGGMDRLQADFDNGRPGLFIIDTLGRVRGSRKSTENEYQCDYRAMAQLQDFGRRNTTNLIAVHHLRKANADDEFDTVSGTHGLTGAADTIAILKRLEQDRRFMVRGRDLDEEDKIVNFDGQTGIWTVTGDFEGKDPGTIDTRNRILDALEAVHPNSMRPQDVAKQLNMPLGTVQKALQRMRKDGQIKQLTYGNYVLP